MPRWSGLTDLQKVSTPMSEHRTCPTMDSKLAICPVSGQMMHCKPTEIRLVRGNGENRNGFGRNGWPVCAGLGGRIHRNTQFLKQVGSGHGQAVCRRGSCWYAWIGYRLDFTASRSWTFSKSRVHRPGMPVWNYPVGRCRYNPNRGSKISDLELP